MKKLFLLAVILACMGMSSECYALINDGFETGDLSGWTSYVPSGAGVAAVASHTGASSTLYSPVGGSYFALLSPSSQGVYTTLSQNFSINAGGLIEGWAAFDACDYMPFNDDAWVKILNATGATIATPWASSVSVVGDYGDGPWTPWSWTAETAGTYTLKYGVANQVDSVLDSYAMFDAKTSGVVPEPATMSLLGFGLLGLLGYRRKK